MKLLLGDDISKLDHQETESYMKGLLELVHRTRGNKRLIRELQLTLTHLQKTAPCQEFGIAYV